MTLVRWPLVCSSIALCAGGCTSTDDASESPTGDSGATFQCDEVQFSLLEHEVSEQVPTVGVVEWAVTGGTPNAATVVFGLVDAADGVQNRGGRAPVDMKRANYRTLLLGLKQRADYVFHIQASFGGVDCESEEFVLPTTGGWADAPEIGVEVVQPEGRDPGFIVTSSGPPNPDRAYIIDADGDVVWQIDSPPDTTRANMDFEGNYMWMLALNVGNDGGEMRYVSMDGAERQEHVAGFERAHHDFTVLPGGRVAAIAWNGNLPEVASTLVVRSPDGSIETPFEIGSNLYKSYSFHANAIHYTPFDGGFTISDRTPNLIVKVSASGEPEWQLGGDCTDAPTGPRCSAQSWVVNHGHHLFEDGTLVLFNNTYTETSHVFEFDVELSATGFEAELVTDYQGDRSTLILGDVQRLPNGNTLVTYSSASSIVELDPSWRVVQTFTGPFAYTGWRKTLYGPPDRP